jgi:hypothetical protein
VRVCRTGCDATPVFEPAKHAFDDVSKLVGIGVERVSALSRWVVGDDRNRSAFAQEESKAIAVIGRISGAQARRWQQGEQRQDDAKIAALSGRYFDRKRSASAVGDGVDLVVRPPRERPIACSSAPLFRPPPSGAPWQWCYR